jgi:hypothetical protein
MLFKKYIYVLNISVGAGSNFNKMRFWHRKYSLQKKVKMYSKLHYIPD